MFLVLIFFLIKSQIIAFVCIINLVGRPQCSVNSSVGFFFLWVWPRVQLFLSSLAPVLLLLSLSILVLLHEIRLRVRHTRQMIYIMMGPSLGAALDIPSALKMRRQHQHQQQQLEAQRHFDARRECIELALLLPTALTVALSRVIYLSLLLLYSHDPVAVALNRPPDMGSSNATSVESSSSNLAHVRQLSLALLVAQIALLATHAVVLPLAAMIGSLHTSFRVFWSSSKQLNLVQFVKDIRCIFD